MEELKKLYQARDILATTEHGVSDDLQQRISMLEQRIIRERFTTFIQEAGELFSGIMSPMDVNLTYNPLTGVSISLNERLRAKQQEKFPVTANNHSSASGFTKYIKSLNITDNTKRRYLKLLNGELIRNLLQKYARTDNLEDVTDLNIIYAMINLLSNDDYEAGNRLRSVLTNYVTYLEKSGQKEELTNRPLIKPRGRNRSLFIAFNDGTVISEKRSFESFCKAIIAMGPEKVRNLDIHICGVPLVTDIKSDNPAYALAQKPIGNGLFVMTYNNTNDKKNLIETIAKQLGIKLRVSIIE